MTAKGSINRTVKRIGVAAAAFLLGLCINSAQAFAAGTVSVTADSGSVAVSGQVRVSVRTSEPEDPASPPEISVSYDPSILEFSSCDVEYGGGEGGLITMTGTGGNITFTALSEGSASVSAEAVIDGDGNNPATGKADITIGQGGSAGSAPSSEAASSKATLRALAIEPGVLTPAFDPGVTDYTITIDEGVTDITVSGGVSEADSQITSASGFKGLEDGDNEAQITVTAADGSTLTYHFNIVRGDTSQASATVEESAADSQVTPDPAAGAVAAKQSTGVNTGSSLFAGAGIGGDVIKSNDMTILVGQNSYTVQNAFPDDLLPEGAVKNTMEYAGQTVEAAVLAEGGYTVVCAVSNTDGGAKLFLYDASADAFQGFVKISSVSGGYIIPVTFPSTIPSGFVIEGCDIAGSYVTCGKLKDSGALQRENVCLIYATDQSGAQDYYLYDLLGGGYVHFLNASSRAMSSSFSKRAIAIMVLLGVSLFVCLIIILVLALKKGEDVYGVNMDSELPPDKHDPFDEEIYTEKKKKRRPSVTLEPEEEQSLMQERKAASRSVKRPVSGDESKPAQRQVRPAKRPVEDMEDEDIRIAEERSSMPEPTVKKVRRKRVNPDRPLPESGTSLDIDREIKAMTESARRQSQTARMADMDAALKARSTTRTVMPDSSLTGVQKTKKSSRPVRKDEITIDNPPRRPAPKSVRPAGSADGEGAPRVKRTVTEKGVTYTTGKIPITVVQPQVRKDEDQAGAVPIFTLDKEDVRPPRETLPGEPDTDFEFGYIDTDN